MWKRAQADTQGGCPYSVRRIRALFWFLVPVRVYCSTLEASIKSRRIRIDRRQTRLWGRTHKRPHVKKIYTTRIHGASQRIAVQRSAAQMLCKQFVPFPALTPSTMHGALPLAPGRTPCQSSLVRCLYECSVPVAMQPTHSLLFQATRCGCGCCSISQLCLLD